MKTTTQEIAEFNKEQALIATARRFRQFRSAERVMDGLNNSPKGEAVVIVLGDGRRGYWVMPRTNAIRLGRFGYRIALNF